MKRFARAGMITVAAIAAMVVGTGATSAASPDAGTISVKDVNQWYADVTVKNTRGDGWCVQAEVYWFGYDVEREYDFDSSKVVCGKGKTARLQTNPGDGITFKAKKLWIVINTRNPSGSWITPTKRSYSRSW
ncbi:hypothetical protein NLX83_22425 [Allokutzneria sp. A3M-2-11 16]|uniref:hypothetical protein n=1 Tax=Allokutzneria sp. A3M-2-11 16 TaxID=2962043 RepID=UPI0020B85BB0|nr:hypothetical protein [Allokutzneria sp. A3M-2-11 16]MCP3802026.1 hypothetical protein [Allokutzneria sp. A3M-2-11 16]